MNLLSRIAVVMFFIAAQSSLAGTLNQGDIKFTAGIKYRVFKLQECAWKSPTSFVEGPTDPVNLWDCSTKKALVIGTQATATMMTIIGICSAPIIPTSGISVSIAFVGVGIGVVGWIMESVPCNDFQNDAIQAQRMCVILREQGIQCDPNKIKVKRKK